MPHDPPRILVVEDDVVLLRIVRTRLARLGYVESVTTLAAARVVLTADPRGFDVWVLDGHLPDGWGPSLVDWFEQHHPAVRAPPACLWSGSPSEEQPAPSRLPRFSKPQVPEVVSWLEALLASS